MPKWHGTINSNFRISFPHRVFWRIVYVNRGTVHSSVPITRKSLVVFILAVLVLALVVVLVLALILVLVLVVVLVLAVVLAVLAVLRIVCVVVLIVVHFLSSHPAAFSALLLETVFTVLCYRLQE